MRRLLCAAASLTLAAGCNEGSPSDPEPEAADTGVDATADAIDRSDADPDVGEDAELDVPALDVQPSACADEDRLHPNHASDEAAAIPTGGLRRDLFLCPSTDDWFRVALRAGQRFDATIEFASRLGDLELYLLPDGAATLEDAVASSRTDLDVETVGLTATGDGAWYVVVHGVDDAGGAYTLDATASCRDQADCADGERCSFVDGHCVTATDGVCGDDEYEENDGPDDATPVEVEADGFAYLSIAVCEEDDDYFALRLDEPSDLALELRSDPGADLDLYLFDSSGSLIAASATAGVGDESIARPFQAAGELVVVVRPYVSGIGSNARGELTVELQAASCASSRECVGIEGRALCEDGACVPFSPATPSRGGGPCDDDGDCIAGTSCVFGGGGIDTNLCTAGCDTDADCSALIDGGSCMPLQFFNSICYPGCDSDADCPSLYACQGGGCDLVSCASSTDCEDGRLCRHSEELDRGYCTANVAAACASDDDLEPNDSDVDPTPLAPGTIDDRRICDTNDDWYAIEVPSSGTRLDVRVPFTGDADIDLDVFIYTAAGTLVASGTEPAANPELASARHLPAGTYLVRVNRFYRGVARDDSTTYSLTVELSDDSCAADPSLCTRTTPLRAACDVDSGACVPLAGGGEIALGEPCDSNDDCDATADLCAIRGATATPRSLCTAECTSDAECAAIPGTTCTSVTRRLRACLPAP